MNVEIARRDDGAIAIVNRISDGFAYGILKETNNRETDWPLPIMTLLARGSWEILPTGRSFALSPPNGLLPFPDSTAASVFKVRPRKYATRREAAQAAARARWGNRAAEVAYAYSQEASTSTRPEPVSVPSRAFEGYGENMGTVLDSILTESVQPFDEDAFLEAAAKGPVSILGIHGKMGMDPDLVFGDEPRGGGMAGPGIYSSLITDAGVVSQMATYERRGRQALLRCDLQKPMIITDADRAADFGKWSGDQFDTMGLMKALMSTGMSKNEAYDEIKSRTAKDPYYQAVRGLKELGFDSIVVIGKNSMVSTFSGSQIKVVDPVLSVEERDVVYAAGNPVLKSADLPFDGRGFTFVPPIVSLLDRGSWERLPEFESVVLAPTLLPVGSDATLEKKMSRSEAGRLAARARWGQVRAPMTQSNIETLAAGKTVAIDAKELPNLMAEMAKKRLPTPLNKVEVKGYNLFQTDLGFNRDQMPQIPTNQKGKFFGFLQGKGITIRPESVDPKTLKPVQSDVLGSRSGKILAKMRAGTYSDVTSDAIVVSSDGYIIDGHHRWAAAVAHSMEKPGYELKVNRIDLPAKTLMVEAGAFTKREGLEAEPLLKMRRWIRRTFRLAPKP